jgi:hypothetical protein
MFHQKKILDVLFHAKKAQDEHWEVVPTQPNPTVKAVKKSYLTFSRHFNFLGAGTTHNQKTPYSWKEVIIFCTTHHASSCPSSSSSSATNSDHGAKPGIMHWQWKWG